VHIYSLSHFFSFKHQVRSNASPTLHIIYPFDIYDNMTSVNTKLLLLAAMLGGAFVKADWAYLAEKGVGLGGCPGGGNIIVPIFENDSFDGMCDDLVADG
jgi:hypothetical protein